MSQNLVFFRFSLRDNVEDVDDIKNVNVVDYVVVEVGQGSGSLKPIKSEIQLNLETFSRQNIIIERIIQVGRAQKAQKKVLKQVPEVSTSFANA